MTHQDRKTGMVIVFGLVAALLGVAWLGGRPDVPKAKPVRTPSLQTKPSVPSTPVSAFQYIVQRDALDGTREPQVRAESKVIRGTSYRTKPATLVVGCSEGRVWAGIFFDFLNPANSDYSYGESITRERVRWDDEAATSQMFRLSRDRDALYVRSDGAFVSALAARNEFAIAVAQYSRGDEVHEWSLVGSAAALAKLPCWGGGR